MKLVSPKDPVLHRPCEEFDFADPPFDPIEFAKELVKFMIDSNGLGLSANQVGVPYKIFAMKSDPNFCCFNPRIVLPSDETIYLEEGCLTYPGLAVKVKRPRHVKVRFQHPNGETKTQTFTGMSARVWQHEYDHVCGVVFYDRATRYHRDQGFRRWKRERGESIER